MKTMFKKLCPYCNNEFETPYKTVIYCSKSCSLKMRWQNNDYRNSMIAMSKEFNNRPDAKEANRQRAIAMWKNEEFREVVSRNMHTASLRQEVKEKRSIIQKEISNKQDVKEKRKNAVKVTNATPETAAKRSAAAIEFNNRPHIKEAFIKRIKDYMNDPTVKEIYAKRFKEYQNRPDVKEHTSKYMREYWRDPVFAENHFQKSFKYKDYELPSGNIVKIQGYEPQVLTELLRTYSEEDIIIGVKEMNKEIGQIKYMFEGKERTYYPDFYIRSENKIIEVKSSWTFELHKEQNIAKRNACIQLGFDFEFRIL